MSKQVEVVALEMGHCGDRVRDEGTTFPVHVSRLLDGTTWFTPTDPEAAAAAIAEYQAEQAAPREATAAPVKPEAKPKSNRPPGAGPQPGSAR